MTLYGLAHLLRDRAAPLWNAVEAANGRLVALSRRKRLARIPGILAARSGPFLLRAATTRSDMGESSAFDFTRICRVSPAGSAS